MFLTKIIEFVFAIALFINALLFIPQVIKILKAKSSKGCSLTTFIGFCLIQTATILYGVIHHDPILIIGYSLSLMTCGTVVGAILIFRKTKKTTKTEKKIKAILKCNQKQKEKFQDSKCLITISVGQQTHEGARFASTINLVNSTFQSCVILVDDSLQRHTMAINTGKDADSLYKTSIKEGDLWLDRNKKHYSKLTIPTKIIRWDRWLHHPNFSKQQEKIKKTIEQDTRYKKNFNDSINEFLEKYYSRLTKKENFDLEKARNLCFEFILEECIGLSLFHELNCQFELYSGWHNAAIEETRNRFVHSHSPNLLQAIRVIFRNAKQLEPQRFELL